MQERTMKEVFEEVIVEVVVFDGADVVGMSVEPDLGDWDD